MKTPIWGIKIAVSLSISPCVPFDDTLAETLAETLGVSLNGSHGVSRGETFCVSLIGMVPHFIVGEHPGQLTFLYMHEHVFPIGSSEYSCREVRKSSSCAKAKMDGL